MAPLEENCHKYGTSKQTFYRWKTKYGGLSAIEVRRLRQLEEENRKLSKIVAERLLSRLAGGEYGMEFLNTEAKRRQGQRLFAYYVLHNFSGWCSFCAIGARPLLEAAHIKPVREFPEIGMDPLNGVALCRNHHRAWDEGILRWCGGRISLIW